MTRRAICLLLALLPALMAAQQPAPDIPVLHTGTRIVSLDVIVTDSNGNLVTGLPSSAFHVFEDGRSQQIQDFREHSFQPPPPPPPRPPDPPGVFTNDHPHWADNTMNILLLDTLNTPLRDQMFVHEQLTEFVKHARPGQEIAILALTTHLVLVQSPTTDPQMLLQALKNLDGLQASPLLGDIGHGMGEGVRWRMRADYTRSAFHDLQRYLSHLPGKKNVIYFSDGMMYGYGPSGLTDRTDAGVFNLAPQDGAEYLVDAAQSSFFYIDAHGLGGDSAVSAEHAGGARDMQRRVLWQNQINADRFLDQQEFADALGGQAFFNSNDLAGETAAALAAGANYYSLNYNPHGHYMDGQYHSIRIRMDNPSFRLYYRKGYVAGTARNSGAPTGNSPDATQDNSSNAPPLATEANSSLIHLSMQRGAAEMTQILYHEKFVPLGTSTGGSVTADLAPGSTHAPNLKDKFRNFDLSFHVDASNLQPIALPNGKLRFRVQFIALTYNRDCLLQTAISKEMDGDLTPAEFTQMRQHGLDLTMQISVPAGHDYFIRTGIHDLTSDNIGTLEVPTALLEKLPAENQPARK